jgi:hypothetical protein
VIGGKETKITKGQAQRAKPGLGLTAKEIKKLPWHSGQGSWKDYD